MWQAEEQKAIGGPGRAAGGAEAPTEGSPGGERGDEREQGNTPFGGAAPEAESTSLTRQVATMYALFARGGSRNVLLMRVFGWPRGAPWGHAGL